MTEKNKPYYLTTAIAYTSGKPHIGNVYEIVLADAIARFKRAQGYDVRFQTGTDEHGQKVEEKAKKAGISPKQFVDQVSDIIKGQFDVMNVSYDKFMRTTDPYHEKQIQKIFKKLYDQGDIYKGHYDGLYCQECEAFYTSSQITEEGKCPVCGGELKEMQEEAYFFRMSKYADRLIEYIETHPHFIQPESRKNEMLNNFLRPGLQDLCVSRTTFSWGIPVDFDPKHVVYVWIDALTNYITGLGYDVDGNSDPLFKKYWPADLHLIGKDIVRFHTIYWPIMLMALDLPLPKQVFGHPWLLTGNDKMSKSKGNVIYADDLVHLFGTDAVRYIMLHEMPFAQDGHITYELMIERINSDLANILGNLVSRTIAMSNKYFDGIVTNPNVSEAVDEELKACAMNAVTKTQEKMDELRVGDALDEIFTLLRRTNKYIDETMPWVLAKDETKKDRLATVLYNLLESIRISAALLHSFLPETAEKMFAYLNTKVTDLDSCESFGHLETNLHVVKKCEPLFARIDEKKFMEEFNKEKEEKQKEVKKEEEKVEEVTIDDFAKLQFKVGTIVKCEPHPKADRLLVEQIDLGNEVRQVVSGIAKHYKPEELVGKQVVVVTNLKPVKLRGVESNGMILCATDDKDLSFVTVAKEMPNGVTVR